MSVHLRRTGESVAEIDALARSRVGLAGILGDLDRRAVPARVPGRAVESGFTWAEPDRSTPRWWPQGITGSADAGAADLGRRVLVTSAYSHVVDGSNHGSRVTFVDLDTLRYRNVLLVVPHADGRLEPLLVHAGGIVWVGPYLYVAGTRRGLFVCRIEDVLRIEDGPFGYEYVLPVLFSYEAVTDRGIEQLRYSFLSLDRSGEVPHLVAGEYGKDAMTTRLLRYALDPETSFLTSADDGRSLPIGPDEPGVGHMQGAAVVGGTWFVSTSRGRWRLGSLYVGKPGAFRRHRLALPTGPEDLTYWPEQDAFWSLSEYPGRRWVYRIPRAQLLQH